MSYSHQIMSNMRDPVFTGAKPRPRRRTGHKTRRLIRIAVADASKFHRWRRSELPSGGIKWRKANGYAAHSFGDTKFSKELGETEDGKKLGGTPKWEVEVTAFYSNRAQWERELKGEQTNDVLVIDEA